MIKNCFICHTDTSNNPSRPGYAFFNNDEQLKTYATTKSSVNTAYTIMQARLRGIETPPMPYQRTRLADSLLLKIDNWINQGAPIN